MEFLSTPDKKTGRSAAFPLLRLSFILVRRYSDVNTNIQHMVSTM